jgi:hypothetical protein
MFRKQEELSQSQQLPLLIVAFVATLLSVAACVWLVCYLRRLPVVVRCRLFPRQALWLCLADIAFAVSKLVIVHMRWAVNRDLCPYFFPVMASTNISYLLEMYICVGFAFQAAKWSRGLRLLRHSGTASVLMGVALVFAEPWRTMSGKLDSYLCHADRLDNVYVYLTMTCLMVSLGSLAFVLAKAQLSSEAVQSRVVFRSSCYVVKSLVTVLPVVISYYFFNDANFDLLSAVANTLQDLNGAANAATYFFQSRYSRDAAIDRRAVLEQTYHVGFNEDVSVREHSVRNSSVFVSGRSV